METVNFAEKNFEIRKESIKEANAQSRNILFAILIIFGFHLTNFFDGSLFDWSKARADAFVRVYACLMHQQPRSQAGPETPVAGEPQVQPSTRFIPLRIPFSNGEQEECGKARGWLPLSFNFKAEDDRDERPQFSLMREIHFEQLRAALQTLERSHQAQIPILGISTHGNNIAIAMTFLMTFLYFSLGLSMTSERRLVREIRFLLPDQPKLYKSRGDNIIYMSVFSDPSKISNFVWLIIFLPIGMQIYDLYYMYTLIVDIIPIEHNYVRAYLGKSGEMKYFWVLLSVVIAFLASGVYLYWRAFGLNSELRRLRKEMKRSHA